LEASRMTLLKFKTYLSQQQQEFFSSLTSPAQIQAFLDETLYSAENANRCSVRVLQDRQAHCLDGALFAAAALRWLGYPPLIVDMLPDPGMDDDHVLAIYKRDGYFGAVAKSNFVGLRFREAIYRNIRELVLSYFEDYYNVNGQKSLRSYTRLLNLTAFDKVGWMWRDEGVDVIEQHLLQMRHIPLLTPQMVTHLSPVDKLSYQAGMLGVNEAGLYKPSK
jgi:hypothetical protein